jgi:hypothetical protein
MATAALTAAGTTNLWTSSPTGAKFLVSWRAVAERIDGWLAGRGL